MQGSGELRQEIEALRDHSSKLRDAILRISAILDPVTVLRAAPVSVLRGTVTTDC